MNQPATRDAYAALGEPATVRIQRVLPGPAERVWAYLTDSDLRRKWLAAGVMTPEPGATFELVWRNDELNDPPGRRPDGFEAEHRLTCRITRIDPPHHLAFTWGDHADVTFTLEPHGTDVLLTIVHRRLPNRAMTVKVGAGWHMHLDLLAAELAGTPKPDFWSGWLRLRDAYEQRVPE